MVNDPKYLNDNERLMVDAAIRALCDRNDWYLYALKVRTNHVHAVVAVFGDVRVALVAMKPHATKALRDAGLAEAERAIWTRGGSTRYLWRDQDVEGAVRYVGLRQGRNLRSPWFEPITDPTELLLAESGAGAFAAPNAYW